MPPQIYLFLDKGDIVFPSQPSCTGYDIAAYTLASAFWNPDNIACAIIKAIAQSSFRYGFLRLFEPCVAFFSKICQSFTGFQPSFLLRICHSISSMLLCCLEKNAHRESSNNTHWDNRSKEEEQKRTESTSFHPSSRDLHDGRARVSQTQE